MASNLTKGKGWVQLTQGTALEGEVVCHRCEETVHLSGSKDIELASTVMDRRKVFKLGLFATLSTITASMADELIKPKIASACDPGGHCVTSGPVPSGKEAISKYGTCCSIWSSFQEEMKAAGALYLDPDLEVNGVTFVDVAKLWNGRSLLKVKVGKKEPMLEYSWNDAIVGPNNWGMAGGKVMYLGSALKGQNRASTIQLLAHEVGHVLSLHHSSSTTDTLMNTRLTGATVPTENDYKALRSAWGEPDGSEKIEDVLMSDEESQSAKDAVNEHIRITGVSPIENERHLLGMENYDEMLKIAETLNGEVVLESRENLEVMQDRKLGDLQEAQEANKSSESSLFARGFTLMGVISIIYGLLMIGVSVLDRVNTFIRVPLLPILTFGTFKLDEGQYDIDGNRVHEEDGKSLKFMILVALGVITLGILLISGAVFVIARRLLGLS